MKSWISLTEREICKYIVMFQVVVYNCSRIWLYERVAENQSNFKICSGVSRRAFPIKKNGRNKKKSNDTNNAKTAGWKYSQIVKKTFLEYSNHVCECKLNFNVLYWKFNLFHKIHLYICLFYHKPATHQIINRLFHCIR